MLVWEVISIYVFCFGDQEINGVVFHDGCGRARRRNGEKKQSFLVCRTKFLSAKKRKQNALLTHRMSHHLVFFNFTTNVSFQVLLNVIRPKTGAFSKSLYQKLKCDHSDRKKGRSFFYTCPLAHLSFFNRISWFHLLKRVSPNCINLLYDDLF